MDIERQPLFIETLSAGELCVTSDGFVHTDESWRQATLYSSHSRLYYVLSGSGVLYSDTEEMILEPGYVYLAPCGMKYGFYGTDSVTKLFFHINIFLSKRGYDAFANYGHFIRLPRTTEFIDLLKSWYLSSDPCDHIMLKAELYQTVGECLRVVRAAVHEIGRYSDTTAVAMGYIYRNLNARLTVKQVVEGIFCSQSKLSTLFRQEVGQSIAHYIDDLLMSEAKNMLIYTEDSIGTISERLGFCDQFYFSRRFAKKFGISPMRYRKKEKSGTALSQ
ncbi:MAG: AraC family transcriptional regulator [Ruminococcaceae bacterium]|nr:AraC family transcriptional regulator [Oscillospiraceae bacterium]